MCTHPSSSSFCSSTIYVPWVRPNFSKIFMFHWNIVPNGGASDLGGAGYAQDGSVAGYRRGVTPRSRVQGYISLIQDTYKGTEAWYSVHGYRTRATPRSQDIKPPFGALEWNKEYQNRTGGNGGIHTVSGLCYLDLETARLNQTAPQRRKSPDIKRPLSAVRQKTSSA